MRSLRSIGLALLLVGFLFKVMHWPGASITLLLGCLCIVAAVAWLFMKRDRALTAGEVIRPLGGVLLLVSALAHALHWPGGTLAMFGMVLLVAAVLLSDRTHVDLPRLADLRAPLLLGVGALLVAGGLFFSAMHWPTAGVQLALGLACGAVWTLLAMRPSRSQVS